VGDVSVAWLKGWHVCLCMQGVIAVVQEEVTMLAWLGDVGFVYYEAREMSSNICMSSLLKLVSPI
jgi:hypothetical protein